MAIRYSGDVEVRMTYGGPGRAGTFDPNGRGYYYAQIRAPRVRESAILSLREVGLNPKLTQKQAVSSEAFDAAALNFIHWTEAQVGELPVELDHKGQIVIRRVFQSPCPVQSPRKR